MVNVLESVFWLWFDHFAKIPVSDTSGHPHPDRLELCGVVSTLLEGFSVPGGLDSLSVASLHFSTAQYLHQHITSYKQRLCELCKTVSF